MTNSWFRSGLAGALMVSVTACGADEEDAMQPVKTDAAWRHCEIEGALICSGGGQVCDMLRNRCVPECEAGTCCDEVQCPAGSECVVDDGRCGIPAGSQCFDMGTAWWTGRDVSPGQRLASTPVQVEIEVLNGGTQPLYFPTLRGHPVRFDLYHLGSSPERKLELQQNHYCSNLCPEQGPVMVRDCEAPMYEPINLPPNGRISVVWSGREEVGMQRLCEKRAAQFCMVSRVTQPGSYAVEVCAYTDASQADGNLTRQNDTRQCQRTRFNHRATRNITVRFND